MLGTAVSSITIRAGVPGRIEAVKSGAESFFRSSSTITSLAICRRLAALSCRRLSRRVCISPIRPSLVGEGSPNDRREDFVQVSEPLDGIGEGLLVDLGIFRTKAIADGAVGDGGKRKGHCRTPLND